MKKVLPVLGILVLGYLGWLVAFKSSGLTRVSHDSQKDAQEAVKASLGDSDGMIVSVSGASNTTWSDVKGYAIVRYEGFGSVKEDDFVIRRDYNKFILHRVSHKVEGGWVMIGDGNSTPDSNLLTEENYVGHIVNKKIWKY